MGLDIVRTKLYQATGASGAPAEAECFSEFALQISGITFVLTMLVP